MIGVVVPQDIETSMTSAEGETLAALAAGKTVLELGAWQGFSTVCLAQSASLLVSVDTHRGDPHAGQASTLSAYVGHLHRYGLWDTVVKIVGRFEDALPLLRREAFDLVFLDGFHTLDQVTADLVLVDRLVAAGGTVCLHDYGVHAAAEGGQAFGVTQAARSMYGEPTRIIDTLAVYDFREH